MAKKEADEKRLRAELAKNPAKQKELGDALGHDREVARDGAAARRRAELHRQRGGPELDAVHAGAADRARGLQPAAGRRGGRARRPRRRAPRRAMPRGGSAAVAAARSAVNLAREKINLTESLAFMQKFLGRRPRDREADPRRQDARGARDGTHREDPHHRPRDPRPAAGRRQGDDRRLDRPDDRAGARRSSRTRRRSTKRYDDEVTAVQAAAYPKIGAAVFAVDGGEGVLGRDRHAAPVVRHGEELHGGRARRSRPTPTSRASTSASAQHNNQNPYDLAPSWADAKAALDPKTPFNLVTHQRHRRRQQRVGDGRQEGRTGRADLRRQHPDAAGLLHLRRGRQPRRSRSIRG